MAASGAYASAHGNLRDTVKWIMAAFTGVGAIVFSGLTITNISSLAQAGQWLLPVGLAAVPLIAAVWATVEALRVINATPAAVGALFPEYWKSLHGSPVAPVAQSPRLQAELPNAIGVYGTADDFDKRLVEVFSQAERARQLLDGTPARQDGYDEARSVLDGLQGTVKDALDCVAYTQARQLYRGFAVRVLIATALALGGLIASGVVTGNMLHSQQAASARAAKTAAPVPVSFTSPTPVRVWLTAHPPAAAGGPHKCPLWNGMPALAVGGTVNRPVLLFPGYSQPAARSHRISSAAPQCADPWLWSAASGEVLVEPR